MHFLTREEIGAHNAALPPTARRTQLPDLASFVPMGIHKFQPREPGEKVEKSHSKIRAEARARRGLLDARQWRRSYVRKALMDAGLLPEPGEELCGHVGLKSDKLQFDCSTLRFRRSRTISGAPSTTHCCGAAG